MTKDEIETGVPSGLRQALIVSTTVMATLFLFGAVFGVGQAIIDRGEIETLDIAILAGLVAALVAALYLMWRVWPSAQPGIESPSTSKSRTILLLITGLGAVLGVVSALAAPDAGQFFFSNGPIAPLWAGVMLLVWLVILPLVSWVWWQTIDEHEATAYREGGFWAAHLYMFLVPAWWVAERAGWLPEQEPMIVFLIVCFFWSGWWLYKRYF